ncbi:protoheme IX farnesyltransferase-like [Sarcoptes scabiei]|nr:protoheme IX farnesyltransferase-like [Sarcoptes scabiei]
MAPISLTGQILTVALLSLQRQNEHAKLASRDVWNDRYDYIVIGAGGAGSIVASRLAEKNPRETILLIEAGGQESSLTDVPGLYHEWVGDPEFDWNFPIAQQSNLGQAYRQPIRMSVGKVLGGSTTISGMVYNRGNRKHFDEWHSRYGCFGWNYDNILKYFLRAENQTDSHYKENHGHSGPITVSSDWNQTNLIPIFIDYLKTAQQVGYKLIDFNGPTQNGVTLFEHTIKNGARVSSASAYLRPNAFRSNLHILTKAFATKIILDGKQAVGIEFNRSNHIHQVMARREIIVSAGTIGSAQLLMLSGIGPAEHLREIGIPLIVDVPVGNNLHDHSNLILHFDVPNQIESYERVELSIANLYDYYVNYRGPLSMFPNVATYLVTNQNDDPEWPDIMTEMVRANEWNNLTNFVQQYAENESDSWSRFWQPYTSRRLLAFDIQMVRPRARGSLRLKSSNPYDQPLIDPNYLGDPKDFEAMVYGIDLVVHNIINQGPFGRNARLIDKTIPGCENLCFGEDRFCKEYIRCFLRRASIPVFRHAGTCRCGSRNDPDAVVDERLRVRNIQRLRVIDGSIMPQIINANSWAATAMIGEYGAQMLIDDNR